MPYSPQDPNGWALGPGGRANHGGVYKKPQLPVDATDVLTNPDNSLSAQHGGIIKRDPAFYRTEIDDGSESTYA